MSGGRDQALVLRRLIVGNFTPEYDTSVNLQLVPSTTILTATVAGIGPDVALQVTGSEPANYAMRDAVAELSGMPGFDEVAARFGGGGHRLASGLTVKRPLEEIALQIEAALADVLGSAEE